MIAAAHERWTTPGLATTIARLGVVRVALLIGGYARARAIVERFCSHSRRSRRIPPGEHFALASALSDCVTRAAVFYPGRAICLEQSLLLYALLLRRGVPAQLQLGVQPFPFTAHAWVEVNGKPVNETEARIATFQRLLEGQ